MITPAPVFPCRSPANREELPCWAHRSRNSKYLTEKDLSAKSAIDVQSEIDVSRIFPALRERRHGFAGTPRRRLFYRDALCQPAQLVDIGAVDNRDAFGAPALDMPVSKSGDAGRIVAAIL
jgi:hypothetical protein